MTMKNGAPMSAVTMPTSTSDGRATSRPTTSAPMPPPTHPDSRFYGTTELPNVVEKAAGAAQDALNKE